MPYYTKQDYPVLVEGSLAITQVESARDPETVYTVMLRKDSRLGWLAFSCSSSGAHNPEEGKTWCKAWRRTRAVNGHLRDGKPAPCVHSRSALDRLHKETK